MAGGSETGRVGAFHCEGKPSSDHRSGKAGDYAELDGPNPYGEGLPTFSNSSARQCSQELKITSAKRAKAAYMRELPKDVRQKVCLLLGSRDAESAIRAANIAKQRGSSNRVIKTKDGGSCMW